MLLSRVHEDVIKQESTCLAFISAPESTLLEHIPNENHDVSDCRRFINWPRLEDLITPFPDGLLYYLDHLCLSKDFNLKNVLLQEFRNSIISDHTGVKRTLAVLAAKFIGSTCEIWSLNSCGAVWYLPTGHIFYDTIPQTSYSHFHYQRKYNHFIGLATHFATSIR